MASFLVRRLWAMIMVLIIVSFLAWGLILLVPGDPAVTLAGQGASPATIAALRQQMGLNLPIPVQYLHWLGNAIQGNFGRSLFSGLPVTTTIAQRIPVTLSLAVFAAVLAIMIGVPLGTLAAFRAGSAIDRIVSAIGSTGIALPGFWFGGILIVVFSIKLRWFPATGFVPLSQDPLSWAWHLLLPALALSVEIGAQLMRQVRAGLVDVMREDYIRTARSKGLSGPHIVVRHALRNAAGPVITVLGLRMTGLLAGTVLIESIFGLPGVGSLIVQAATSHDLYIIQGITVLFTVVVLIANLVVDLSYAWLNPRVQLS